jgi:hypothetical protein
VLIADDLLGRKKEGARDRRSVKINPSILGTTPVDSQPDFFISGIPRASLGTHLPELGTDLVTALASLNVDDFAVGRQGGGGEEERVSRRVVVCRLLLDPKNKKTEAYVFARARARTLSSVCRRLQSTTGEGLVVQGCRGTHRILYEGEFVGGFEATNIVNPPGLIAI